MHVEIIPVLDDNYIFILVNDKKEAVVIDPAKAEPVMDYIDGHGLNLKAVLNTHHHYDHVGGNLTLKERYSCEIWGNGADAKRLPGIDRHLNVDSSIEILGNSCRIIDVPGHTIGHIAYWFDQEQKLFCGDTLFSLGCGRLFEGTPDQMWASLQKLKSLPPQTLVYCTHEYTMANAKFAVAYDKNNDDLIAYISSCEAHRKKDQPTIPTSLGTEFQCNPFLRADSPELADQLPVHGDPARVFAYLRSEKDNF